MLGFVFFCFVEGFLCFCCLVFYKIGVKSELQTSWWVWGSQSLTYSLLRNNGLMDVLW